MQLKLLINLAFTLVAGATAEARSNSSAKNPFVGRTFYINPVNQAEYDESISSSTNPLVTGNLGLMRNTPSAYWIDTMDKITGTSTRCVEGILTDAASKSPPELVVLIWYDLPNRDCDAHASNGEICCTYNLDGSCNYLEMGECTEGVKEYSDKYVDPFIEVLKKFTGKLPVVIVFEPDSLPNLATNLDDPKCANPATQASYKKGSQYALSQLAAETDVSVYMDAGHGGWLGWEDNLLDYLNLLKELDLPLEHVRGFSTDVSGYQPLGIMCPWEPDKTYRNGYCLNGKHADEPCCYDPCSALTAWDPANNELNYAQELHEGAKGILDWDAHVITDTGRNGVPDARIDCADWCNIRGAGAGLFPTADVANPDIIDAYYWLKTPGESDGCTKTLPDGKECPRFDTMCGSQDSLGNVGSEPKAPEAGGWYDYQVKQLAANAHMTPPPTPPPTQASPTPLPNPNPTHPPTPSPPGPSGSGKCCWGDCSCVSQNGWCDESEGNCAGNCGGTWCPGILLKQVRRHRLRSKREEGDGTAMLQGDFYDAEEFEEYEEEEVPSEGRNQEL